jgi:hypothetical protein
MKLCIATPSTGMCPIEFAFSLATLVGNLQTVGLCGKPVELDMNVIKGSVIHDARENQVEAALQANCTHILFIDSDMTFTYQALDTMVKRNKQVVLTNYLMKEQNPSESKFTAVGFDRQKVQTTEKSEGLEKVLYGGLGFALIDLSIFSWKNPQPRFQPKWKLSEDAAFCDMVRASGYDVFLDHSASKEIGHVGTRSWYWWEANGK